MTPQLQHLTTVARSTRPVAPLDLRRKLYRTACMSSISLAVMTIRMRERWDEIDAAKARADINRRVMEQHHPISPEALDS